MIIDIILSIITIIVASYGVIKAIRAVINLTKQEKDFYSSLSKRDIYEISLLLKAKQLQQKKNNLHSNIQISEKEFKELQEKIIELIIKSGETNVLEGIKQKDKKGQVAYMNKILQNSGITKETLVTTEP
jgi:hypothetical protein